MPSGAGVEVVAANGHRVAQTDVPAVASWLIEAANGSTRTTVQETIAAFVQAEPDVWTATALARDLGASINTVNTAIWNLRAQDVLAMPRRGTRKLVPAGWPS